VAGLPHWICTTCGTQFKESAQPPEQCGICADERQWVNWQGQSWTTLAHLRRDHRNTFTEEEPGLLGIRTEPSFAIGQRALLITTAAGNVLWDCVSLIDPETVNEIRRRGSLAAIAISHPHFYSSMVEWSRAFGDAPVYVHADDRMWIMRPDDAITPWQGASHVLPGGLTLLRCGGHFRGSAVLHWPGGAGGRGALLTGDTLQVVPDRRHVSVMYSYPNLIPVDAATFRRIAGIVEPLRFDRVYGGFSGRVIAAGAHDAVVQSLERYEQAVRGQAASL